MAISNITTGEQTVTTTGAVTGTLNTSSLTGDFTLHVRIRSTSGTSTAGDTIKISIEDTANSSEFSDAQTVAVVDVEGGWGPEGVVYNFRSYEVPSMRYGATHNELRLNCLDISGGSFAVLGWLEQ